MRLVLAARGNCAASLIEIRRAAPTLQQHPRLAEWRQGVMGPILTGEGDEDPMAEDDFSARPTGIVAALAEEAAGLFQEIATDPDARVIRLGGREFHKGRLWGRPCVLTLARIGKVAAATTATALVHAFNVDSILLTGVAGAAAPHVKVGDVVIADALLQHDLDASPIFPRYEVPFYGLSRFPTDTVLSDGLAAAAGGFLSQGLPNVPSTARSQFGLAAPSLWRGLIVSGDRFVNGHDEVDAIRRALPEALAIEMEGAAMAQVCHDYGVRLIEVRTISDAADDTAHVDFPAFLQQVASHYSYEITRRFLARPSELAPEVGS
jgi:adenosylhomocysteine nucleosidase